MSIFHDAMAWLRRKVIRGAPPEAAHETSNTPLVVYSDNDAYLAYVMTEDNESLGADATHSSPIPALPPVNAEITTSTITTPPSGDEKEKALDVGFSKRDTQAHSNTTPTLPPAASVAEITTSTITMLPGDEMETTRILNVMVGEVDMQSHFNTTSTLPSAPSVAEITTGATLRKDEGRPTLDVVGFGQTDEVDVGAPDSETKTPEHKVPTAQIQQLGPLTDFLRGRELLHRREALRRRES